MMVIKPKHVGAVKGNSLVHQPIIVSITQTQAHEVKKSGGCLIKSLLNCGDTMIKRWKTAAFTKCFEIYIHIQPPSTFCFTTIYTLNDII
jgi:hypothetical protein